MTPAVPFRLRGESGRRTFVNLFDRLLMNWVGEWFFVPPEFEFRCEPPETYALQDASDWLVFGDIPEFWVALRLEIGTYQDVSRYMFSAGLDLSERFGALAELVVNDCLIDLCARTLVCGGRSGNCDELNRGLGALRFGYGSGVEFGSVVTPTFCLNICFGGALVDAIQIASRLGVKDENPIRLARRELCLGGGLVGLEVVLGEAEICLSDLATISVGDVIRLTSSHNQPLVVRTNAGRNVGRVDLGARGKQMAIQFTQR